MARRVEFHTGVADPVGFACRLLRKAYGTGARLAVCAPPTVLARLDRELWTFVEREFVPHVRLPRGAQPGRQAARTPIWLLEDPQVLGLPAIVVNLGSDPADWPVGVERLIEVVGASTDDEQPARARWKRYKAEGCEVIHHNARSAPAEG